MKILFLIFYCLLFTQQVGTFLSIFLIRGEEINKRERKGTIVQMKGEKAQRKQLMCLKSHTVSERTDTEDEVPSSQLLPC